MQESLWISPAAAASNTSRYTFGNMTTALPPSSLHLNALQHPVTPWLEPDLVSRELRAVTDDLPRYSLKSSQYFILIWRSQFVRFLLSIRAETMKRSGGVTRGFIPNVFKY